MPVILPSDWRGRVRHGAGLSPQHAALSQRVLQQAVQAAHSPLTTEPEPGGRRLQLARRLSGRVRHALVAHGLTADPGHLAVLVADLRAVLDLPDWGDDHLLDMAELSTAVALALDGAGAFLPRDLLQQAGSALCRRYLPRAIASVQGGSRWSCQPGNWAFVCAGAMIVVAAVAGRAAEPGLPRAAAEAARRALAPSLAAIGPGGDWPEGVVYRDLAAGFGWLAMQAAQAVPALQVQPETFLPLLQGATLRAALTGPSGQIADFGDDLPTAPLPVLGSPNTVLPEAAQDPLHLLWGWQIPEDDAPPPPVFLGRHHAVLRQGPDFLALRLGASASHDHAHADLGAPIWDHGPQRLLADPGRGDYAAPGYFDPKLRMTRPGVSEADHGTLSFAAAPQGAQMSAEAEALSDGLLLTMRLAGRPFWQRKLWFAGPGHLIIVDQSLNGGAGPAQWHVLLEPGAKLRADLPPGPVVQHGAWSSAKGSGARLGFALTADQLAAGVQVGLRAGALAIG